MARQELLRAIAANPHDDAYRLVFADWLDEQGDDLDAKHAELIRTQIELAQTPRSADRHAELKLLEKKSKSVGFDLKTSLDDEYQYINHVLNRGFPSMLGHCSTSLRRGILSQEQLDEISRIRVHVPATGLLFYFHDGQVLNKPRLISSQEANLDLLSNWFGLSQFETLNIGSYLFSDGNASANFTIAMDKIGWSPNAINLRELIFGTHVTIDEQVLSAISNAPYFKRVTGLHLKHDQLSIDVFDSLSTLKLLKQISFLRVMTKSPPRSVRMVIDRTQLRQLTFSIADQASLEPLIGCLNLNTIEQLSIKGDSTHPDDSIVTVLKLNEFLAQNNFHNLNGLTLQEISLTEQDWRALVESPISDNLNCLKVIDCGFRLSYLPWVRKLLSKGKLRSLQVSGIRFIEEQLIEIAAWPELRCLHHIDFVFEKEINFDGEIRFESDRRSILLNSPYRHPFLIVN